MHKKLMAVVVLALALLSFAVLFGGRDPASPTAAAIAPSPVARPASKLPQSQPQPDAAPSPWAARGQVAAVPGAAASSAGAALPLRQRDLQELEKIKMELSDSMRDGKPDPKKVVEVLTKLKQMNGPSVAGVNLDAVINKQGESCCFF